MKSPKSVFLSVRLWAEEQTERSFNSEVQLVLIDNMSSITNHPRKKLRLGICLSFCLFCSRLQGKWNNTNLIILFLCWVASSRKKKNFIFFWFSFQLLFFSILLNVKDPFPFRLNFFCFTPGRCVTPGVPTKLWWLHGISSSIALGCPSVTHLAHHYKVSAPPKAWNR